MSETWLSELDKDFLVDISTESKVFSKSDLAINSRGGPFGGTGWVIHKDFTILHHRTSYITNEYMSIKWLIIGVYMPFDNNKIDSYSDYETNLSIISELSNSYKRMGDYNIIIGGDFNADLKRNKRFDKRLNKFIKKEKLLTHGRLNLSRIDYTYSMNNYTVCLDHIFVLNTSQFIKDCLSEIKSIIKEDVINTSDHHPVFMEIHFS